MLPPSQIVAYWIPLAEAMPAHGTHCLVGNADERDSANPLLGTRWRAATYLDSDFEQDHFSNCVLKCKMEHVKRFVMHDIGGIESRPVEAFTHWWPIPHPFSPWNGKGTT